MHELADSAADEVLLALTHGLDNFALAEYEIVESWTEDDTASAIVEIDGRRFVVTVSPEGEDDL